jgi:anthranilate phosphoribosyltransferase
MKGATSDEITGAAMVMREKVTRIDAGDLTVVDTCGTGGSGHKLFNISTTAGLVAAGAGVRIAKHGNRGMTSSSGSSDVLEALGVNVNAGVPVVEECIREAGFGFMFAPLLHGAMKYAVPVRKQIGIRTVFNVLGPLTNPAGARRQVMGVFDVGLVTLLAEVLRKLGAEHALVVHGSDGLDEITLAVSTKVAEVRPDGVKTYEIMPEDMGLAVRSLKSLYAESPQQSAEMVRRVLKGEAGPHRDIVLANAAAAIYVADEARNLMIGVEKAAESIDSGRAAHALARVIEITNA